MKISLALQAAAALAECVGQKMFDCSVHISKIIPSQAGLGGGTADAAAVLFGLNRLYDLRLSDQELLNIAPSIGADVPFCLTGGTARVGGIGEQIKPLPALKNGFFLIAMPHNGSSTRRAFQMYDACPSPVHPETDKMELAIASRDLKAIGACCHNVFEDIVSTPESLLIKKCMIESGALAAATTGSGAAIFSIFETRGAADRCRKKLKAIAKSCFITIPQASGIKQV